MAQETIRGSCLCGEIRYEVDPPFARMVHCHCSRCRKGTGTGHATNVYVPAAQLRYVSGEEKLSRYDLPSAKSFSKWFCRQCGSPMARISRSGKIAVIPAGSLDTFPPIAPSDHIFWGSKAPWACVAGDLPTHDEYPPGWA